MGGTVRGCEVGGVWIVREGFVCVGWGIRYRGRRALRMNIFFAPFKDSNMVDLSQ